MLKYVTDAMRLPFVKHSLSTNARQASLASFIPLGEMMIYAITALFIFQLLGEVVVQAFSIPLPGPLAGMLLLTLALLIRGKAPVALEQTAGKLLQHLMLLFIPAVTGVMMHFERVASEWLPFIAATLGGTVLTLIVTGAVLNYLLNKKEQV